MDASASQKNRKRAAIYARVSTLEQVDGTSLATQVERCRAYVESQGWSLAGELVDEGVSGAKAARPALDRLLDDVAAAGEVLDGLRREAAGYLAGLEEDPGRLAVVEERLALLERIARRFGGSIGAAIARREAAAALVAAADLDAGGVERLAAAVEEHRQKLGRAAAALHAVRREVAAALAAGITEDLRGLLMPHARFRIQLDLRDDPAGIAWDGGRRVACGPGGVDEVRFELAANPQDPERPLGEVASGGEMARVVLCLEARLAAQGGAGTVVFDEVDAGLGGEAANRVGERLQAIAGHRQVVCVTHLAPIAARAAHHLRVTKRTVDGRSDSTVEELGPAARVEELGRLLAGEATPAAARVHARELLAALGPGTASGGPSGAPPPTAAAGRNG